MNNIAAAYDGMGNWAEAMSIYETALELRREIGDQEGEAKTLQNLAVLHARHGNRGKAKTYLNKALVLARQSGSRALANALRKTMSQLPRFGRG